MQNNPLNFADAEPQNEYGVIPHNTLAKVKMFIKAGGHDDAPKGWTGGLASRNSNTGSVALNVEFTIVDGQYAGRKVWSYIGLYSPSSEKYAKMGKSFFKAILESANRVDPQDKSAAANRLREIDKLSDLNGVEFVAKIEVENDNQGKERNKIRFAITKGHKEYESLMGKVEKDNGRFTIGAKKEPEPVSDIQDDPMPF